jgi:alpha/beta superfamily hydrolase
MVWGPTEGGERAPLYERYTIELLGAEDAPDLPDADNNSALGVHINGTRGKIPGLFHAPEGKPAGTAVLYVPGARGGFGGPANGLYAEVAQTLAAQGVAGLRLDYRHPANLDESTLDALVAVWHLAAQGYERVAVVGHSFGGAVAISVSRYSTHVRAVAALSSQSYGAEDVVLLAPRPLLLIHGERDGVIPPQTARDIYGWAFEPKRLVLLAGADHGLREVRDEVRSLLVDWLPLVALG